jgi:hypothetical protein
MIEIVRNGHLQAVCLRVDHAVLGLEVAVGNALLVHVGHSTQQLAEVVEPQLLRHSIVAALYVVQQVWTPHELKLQSISFVSGLNCGCLSFQGKVL